jgi:hypothetical protein
MIDSVFGDALAANGQSICEGMELKLLQLHLCFVVDYCFVAER